MNFISFDFIHPVLVHAIIERNQKQPNCTYAMYCEDEGECTAMSRMQYVGQQGSCDASKVTSTRAQAHSGVKKEKARGTDLRKFFLGVFLLKAVFFMFYALLCPYSPCPTCVRSGEHCGIFFARLPASMPFLPADVAEPAKEANLADAADAADAATA